jgi:signal transduction histidine kinase
MPVEICALVVPGLGLPAIAVQVGTAVWPTSGSLESSGSVARFAIRHRRRPVGELVVRPRACPRALDQVDRSVLQWLTDQAEPAVLAQRLADELRVSREQLVSAPDAERLRLRRDIHDELGPMLAGVRLRLDTARAVGGDPGGRPAAGNRTRPR